jgi:hypothetical protein
MTPEHEKEFLKWLNDKIDFHERRFKYEDKMHQWERHNDLENIFREVKEKFESFLGSTKNDHR